MRRTNSSPDLNTLWTESGAVESEHFRKGSVLQESGESDKESFVFESSESDSAKLPGVY